jgi:hypothetical protein
MPRDDDEIEYAGSYKSVPLHAGQSEARLEAVRRDIDDAYRLTDPQRLLAFLDDVSKAPEARIFVQARLLAELDIATEDRARRPAIDRDLVLAYSSLRSRRWRDPYSYKSLLDGCDPPLHSGQPRSVRREVPLPLKDR